MTPSTPPIGAQTDVAAPMRERLEERKDGGNLAIFSVAEIEGLLDEIERLRDRAVCSGCGQDVDEGGGCTTDGCNDLDFRAEMIPSSDLPAAMRANLERRQEERDEWRFDWEQLRSEAKALAAALERIIALDKHTERLGFAQGIARAALGKEWTE